MRKRLASLVTLKRRWRHPAVLFVLVGVLTYDYLSLPWYPGAKSWAGGLRPRWGLIAHRTPVMGDAFRTPDGSLVWAYDHPKGPEELAPPVGSVAQHITVWVDIKRFGAWALTHETRSWDAHYPFGAPLSDAVRDEVRRALLDVHGRLGPWPKINFVIDLLRAGKTTSTRILPWGYVHNAISLSIALTLVGGLALDGRDLRRQSIRSRRQRRGQCPSCGYEMRDLATCPECGEPRIVNPAASA